MGETIKCPKCETVIDLTEILKKRVAKEVEQEFDKRLKAEVARLNKEGDEALERIQKELDKAKENELSLRRQKTELEQKAKDIDLEVQRKLDEEKAILESRIVSRVVEDHRAKDAEKDKKISDALAQVDELKRKMEQGSQQTQGEALELELENALKLAFPGDDIKPVAKGVRGGDIIQIVKTRSGEEAGKILWELKRTKAWSQAWLPKLREDVRECRAEMAILATEAMPEGSEDFMRADGGVWVSSIRFAMPLCHALRAGILRASAEKNLQAGKKDKAVILYEYLTGSEFRGRLEAIAENYIQMNADLEAERRAFEKIWAKRQKQIGVTLTHISGMYGDIEGLAGNAIAPIPALQLPGGKG